MGNIDFTGFVLNLEKCYFAFRFLIILKKNWYNPAPLKKVLIITSEFPPQPGGIGNHALNLGKGLQENGFEVELISDIRSKGGVQERDFDREQPFNVVRIPRRDFIFLSYLDRVRASYSLAKNNEIVVCSGKFSLWTGAILSFFLKRKFYAIIHGSEIRLPNFLFRKFTDFSLKRFNTVIAVSNYTKSLVSHLNLKRIIVIPNGYEMVLPPVAEEKNKPGPVLITVGNVTKRKGQHNVINALPKLLKKYPDLKYHIVGIPTDQVKLEKLALKLGVESSVVFFGKVSDELKAQFLQQSDIFVMLSESTTQGDVEGFGIAILEANAIGIPAIGSLGCGIEDAIKEGVSGKLINNKDPEQFILALKDILAHYDTYSKQSKLWSRNFTWEKVIKDYLKVFNEQN